MAFPWMAAISGITSFIGGLFNFKSSQAQVITSAIDAVNQMNISEGERAAAVATIIANEARSESWLTRTWRPLVMMICVSMIVAAWFGYIPSHMPPGMVDNLFDLVKIGLGGYIGGRSLEKIADKFVSPKIVETVQKFILKKIV